MSTSRIRIPGVLSLIWLLVLAPLPAVAEGVGKVAATAGSAEIVGTAGARPAEVGMEVVRGDRLRTGRPGRLQVVFRDDTMLVLSDVTEVVVDDQVIAPEEENGKARSLLDLVQGKVRSVVSEYYGNSGNVYEVRTGTATAGVRGTEFTVRYDPQRELTEILGISGVVAVHSLVDPTGPGVLVTAAEATAVVSGQLPDAPRQLDKELFEKELEDVRLLAGAAGASISGTHAILNGSEVPDPDRAAATGSGDPSQRDPAGVDAGRRDAGSLLGQSPAAVRSLGGLVDIDVGQPR